MVEVCSFHFQHTNQLVVLLKYLIDSVHSLIIAPVVAPWEVGVLVADKAEYLKKGGSIVLNK